MALEAGACSSMKYIECLVKREREREREREFVYVFVQIVLCVGAFPPFHSHINRASMQWSRSEHLKMS